LTSFSLFIYILFIYILCLHKIRYRNKYSLSREVNYKYYMSITVANSSFLIFRVFDSWEQTNWKLSESDLQFIYPIYSFLCKVCPYLKQVARCCGFMFIVSYSLERAYSVAFPLSSCNKRAFFSFFFVFVSLVSFLLPIPQLYQITLVRSEEAPFSFSCDISTTDYGLYNTFMIFYLLFVVVLPFMAIISTNLASIISINRKKKIGRFNRTINESLSITSANSKKENHTNNNNEIIKLKKSAALMTNIDADVNTTTKTTLQDSKHNNDQTSDMNIIDSNEKLSESFTDSIRRHKTKMNDDVAVNQLNVIRINGNISNNRRHNKTEIKFTKSLILLTLAYTLLNLPFFIIWSVYAHLQNTHNEYKKLNGIVLKEDEDLIWRVFYYLKVSEVLHLCNYLLTGILFIISYQRWLYECQLKEKKKHISSATLMNLRKASFNKNTTEHITILPTFSKSVSLDPPLNKREYFIRFLQSLVCLDKNIETIT
jgi:hypothetical protein